MDNEIKILLLLFKQKKLTSKEISQKTAITFDAVHYSLHSLEKKGIIRRSSSNGEDVVEVTSDQEFLQWVDDKKKHNGEIYDEAKEVLQTFFTTMQESAWKPNVTYFEGKQGIIDIYEDMLAKGKDIYCWTDIQKIDNTLGKYMDEFIKKRVEKGITTFAIMPMNEMNMKHAKKSEKRNTKFSNHLPIDGEIRMYGDRVAVITFHQDNPVGFVFTGPVIASVFMGIFDHAWHNDAEALSS